MYNSPEEEIELALSELKKIMELRIHKYILETGSQVRIHHMSML